MSGIILVRDVMAKNIKTVRTDDTAHSAVIKMNKFNIGSVIVTNNNRPVGIITATNILKRIVEPRLDPAVVNARDIMTSPLITIDADTSLEDAASVMRQKKVKTLPVMNKDSLSGVISVSDIAKASPTQVSILQELLRIQ